jgi:hypothetical protein
MLHRERVINFAQIPTNQLVDTLKALAAVAKATRLATQLMTDTGPSVRTSRAEAYRAKGTRMRIQHLPFMGAARDPCPVCGLEIALDVVEPHPADERLEIQGYMCKKCGPVKSLVVLRSSPPHLVM